LQTVVSDAFRTFQQCCDLSDIAQIYISYEILKINYV